MTYRVLESTEKVRKIAHFSKRKGYWGGINVQYEEQKTPVPELASAIWSESSIGGVRYRRFHCIRIHVYMLLKGHSILE